jgi:hypothetical protein
VAAGYSGTPLAQKLGLRPGTVFALLDAPADWSVPDLPVAVHTKRARRSASALRDVGVAVAFCRTIADVDQLASLVEAVAATGSLWVAWPRKAAGHVSEVSENLLRERLLPTGVVDVKVAALDNDWSGLKFVWRKHNRADRPQP